MHISHIAIWTTRLEELRNFYITYFNGTSNEMYINPKKGFESYFISFDQGFASLEIMQREDIKSYKDACKIINRKPRRYRDNHINAYEQLSTITAAVNYIETGTQWKHIVKPNNKFYEIYYWKTFNSHSNNESDEGLFALYSHTGVSASNADVGSNLRFATSRGAEYVKTTFKILLRQWFDPDSIK